MFLFVVVLVWHTKYLHKRKSASGHVDCCMVTYNISAINLDIIFRLWGPGMDGHKSFSSELGHVTFIQGWFLLKLHLIESERTYWMGSNCPFVWMWAHNIHTNAMIYKRTKISCVFVFIKIGGMWPMWWLNENTGKTVVENLFPVTFRLNRQKRCRMWMWTQLITLMASILHPQKLVVSACVFSNWDFIFNQILQK